jgi:hypothetical protein
VVSTSGGNLDKKRGRMEREDFLDIFEHLREKMRKDEERR